MVKRAKNDLKKIDKIFYVRKHKKGNPSNYITGVSFFKHLVIKRIISISRIFI